MGTSPETPKDRAHATTPPTTKPRAWSKPVLVEYGHLAKLTRGPSGTQSESATFKKPPAMCL